MGRARKDPSCRGVERQEGLEANRVKRKRKLIACMDNLR
jgi:hypothetical protein